MSSRSPSSVTSLIGVTKAVKLVVLDGFLIFIYVVIVVTSRSWRPRGLRYELSTPAQTLGSWVPIPL
jgi:hypothetical protein